MGTKIDNTAKESQKLCVWMLTAEDVTENEWTTTIWSSKAKAKEAMEKDIEDMLSIYANEGSELVRDDDEHAYLEDHMRWSIDKMLVDSGNGCRH